MNFLGSAMLASIAIRSKGRVLSVSRQNVPVVRERDTEGFETAYDKALLRMPKIQQQVRDSYVAAVGLIILTVGFGFQLAASIWS